MIKKTLWELLMFFAMVTAAHSLLSVSINGYGSVNLKARLESHYWILQVHMAGGGVAIILGLCQVQDWIRERFPNFHKRSGRLYVLCVLAAGLSGLFIASRVNGGVVPRLGFSVWGVACLYTLGVAFYQVKQGNIHAHRNWMTRNFALILAAVLLKIYITIMVIFQAYINPKAFYSLAAWMCWIPTVIIAELFFVKMDEPESDESGGI